jgi:hypothetical protein
LWQAGKANAMSSARSAAARYFTDQGVDPTPYMGAINDMITEKANSLAELSPVGTTFQDLGSTVYNNAQTAERGKASRALDTTFPTNFDYQRLPDTYDDATLAAIDAEQRKTADQFVQNMLSRGVINQSGYDAAETNLGSQDPGVMARLTEQGNLALEGGRQSLRDVRSRAGSAADALKVGQTFDANSYGKQLDDAFNSFITNLGGNIRGRLGNAQLYDTSGLATIAGAAQGNGPGIQPTTTGLPFSTDDETNKNNQIANRTNASTGLGF